MYATLPSFVLGFHGCDESLVKAVISGKKDLNPSENDYDWLGHGMYFWESDHERALAWAKHLQKHPERGKVVIKKPAVLGAIIDLGHCLNLIESHSLSLIQGAYNSFKVLQESSGQELPKNTPLKNSEDLLKRNLDCAVIEYFHTWWSDQKQESFDSVRGVFWEGSELYPNAGFKEKNHIQICVRNPNCIKGYFLPRKPSPGHRIP